MSDIKMEMSETANDNRSQLWKLLAALVVIVILYTIWETK